MIIGPTTADDSVTRLSFQLDQDFKKLDGWKQEADQPLPNPASFPVTFYLSDTRYQTETPEETTVIDFSAGRIYTIHRDASYRERSIFSDIAYRHWELSNREHIREVLEAGNIEQRPWAFATSMSEHLFSVSAEEGGGNLIRSDGEHEVAFSLDDELLFSYSKSGVELTSKQIDCFWRAFRIQYGLHPLIHRELTGLKHLPTEFISRGFVTAIVRRHFTFQKSGNQNDHQFLEPTGARTVDSIELNELYQLGTTLSKEKYRNVAMELTEEAVELAKEEKYLEAILKFIEVSLVTGGGLPDEFEPMREQITENESVTRLFANLSPTDRESAESAVTTLEQLEQDAGKAAYILKIFRANILSGLQVEETPLSLMNEAIRENPYIVGLWNDLAKQYRTEYWEQDYWLCWDIARKLNPDHSMLDELKEFETSIFEKNRVYFPPEKSHQ